MSDKFVIKVYKPHVTREMAGSYSFTIDISAGDLANNVGVYMDILFEELPVPKKKVVVFTESKIEITTIRNYIKSPEFERVVETCDLEEHQS